MSCPGPMASPAARGTRVSPQMVLFAASWEPSAYPAAAVQVVLPELCRVMLTLAVLALMSCAGMPTVETVAPLTAVAGVVADTVLLGAEVLPAASLATT